MDYKEQFDRDGYVVIDDFVDLFDQEHIKATLFNFNFPYYFVSDIIWGKDNVSDNLKNKEKYPGLYHVFVADGQINSPHFIDPIQRMIIKGSEVVGSDFKNILFSRSFLTMPLQDKFQGTVKKLHIDDNGPHIVVLYYVIDADGETLLTKIKHKPNNERDYNLYIEDENVVIERVTPKQGRVLIFDGMHYHTGLPPKDGVRSIINTILN